jgi:hypothetical protein
MKSLCEIFTRGRKTSFSFSQDIDNHSHVNEMIIISNEEEEEHNVAH